MPSRRISLTAVAIGVAIVQSVLPVPALAGINHVRVPQWRVEVNQIDAGGSSMTPEFKIAIYENLVTELAKAKQFSAVLRSGDSSANGVSNLLILKTTVESYTPGSETKRAVTTVTGATKLKVRNQLCTRTDNWFLSASSMAMSASSEGTFEQRTTWLAMWQMPSNRQRCPIRKLRDLRNDHRIFRPHDGHGEQGPPDLGMARFPRVLRSRPKIESSCGND